MFDPKEYKGLGGSPENENWPTIPKIGSSSTNKRPIWPASSEADTQKPISPFSSKGKNIKGDIDGITTILGENRENYLQNQKQLRVIGKLIKAGITIVSLIEILLLAGYNLNPKYMQEHHPILYNVAFTQEILFWKAIDLFERNRVTPDDLPPSSSILPADDQNTGNIQTVTPEEAFQVLEQQAIAIGNGTTTLPQENFTPVIVAFTPDMSNKNTNNITPSVASVIMI